MHLIDSLYSEEFDFAASAAPTCELMIASLPRAGSTYFCIDLWKTGVLGAPLEYANLEAVNSIRDKLAKSKNIVDYWEKTRKARTGPNGVFSYKMFMSMYFLTGRKERAMLKKFTPDKVVYLTRADKLAQAVSYSKAIRSRIWFSGTSSNKNVEYDRAHIHRCTQHISSQERFWEGIFERTGTEVFRVTFEDFLDRPEEIKKNICTWVGQPYDESLFLKIPNLSKQGDDSNIAWCKQYATEVL